MRKDVLARRANPGVTERRFLALLRTGPMTARQIAELVQMTQPSAARVLRRLVEKGCAEEYDEVNDSEQKYARAIVTAFAFVRDLPPQKPVSEHRRAYFRLYRARQRAGLPTASASTEPAPSQAQKPRPASQES
jgi:hypothetical protein